MNSKGVMKNKPSNKVLNAFDLPNELISLKGGEGGCWRAGHAILKPCDDLIEWRWMGEVLSAVKLDGFRVPLVLCARNGDLAVDGWCAQTALEGSHPIGGGRWGDVIAVGERFHRAIADFPRPDFLDERDDPWALGDRVAWGEVEAPVKDRALCQMLDLCEPLDLPQQLVHGDLTENVLFAEGLPPAIIDFSPYWRPVGFSAAVVVADAVCWRKADPDELLGYVSSIEEFPQLLVRALIYRMVTTLAFKNKENLNGYNPGIEMVQSLIE